MVEVCDTCIGISTRDPRRTWDGKKSARTVQCPDCDALWEQCGVETIMFRKNRDDEYVRLTWTWYHNTGYRPVSCTQRKCTEHARHKVAKRGKRKFKCDRHAGVCIIA